MRNVKSSHDTRVSRNSTQCQGAANAAFCGSTALVVVSLETFAAAGAWGSGRGSNAVWGRHRQVKQDT